MDRTNGYASYQAREWSPGDGGSVQYAPSSWSGQPAPNQPAPNQYAPNQYAPNQPAPNAPNQYAPNQYAPNQYAPNQYAPNQYAPNQYAPNQYAPNQYAPNQYAPNQYAPNPYAPNQYPPNAYGPPGQAPQGYGRNAQPTGREVFFGADEIIVSKTNTSGKITYANSVFLRVSSYQEHEVIGQPHSFIRHPEMPRLIFKYLWDSIQSGREIFAYVVNLTKYGDHYWVFAHVTPTFNETGTVAGYHSMRRCPKRDKVERVRALYRQLLNEERNHSSKADAIAASSATMQRLLDEKGQSYEEFIFAI